MVLMAFILFVGSVYLLLTAVLGRWMGYLVLMVAFSGWMMVLSSLCGRSGSTRRARTRR